MYIFIFVNIHYIITSIVTLFLMLVIEIFYNLNENSKTFNN